MDVAELVIKAVMDGAGVQAGSRQAEAALDNVKRSAAELGDALKEIAGKAAGWIGAIAGVASIKGAVSEYLEQAEVLGKLSDALGVDIEELQGWQDAIASSGGTADTFNGTLKSLTSNLEKAAATGSGEFLTSLRSMGISIKDLSGKTKTVTQLLPELADKFQGMSKAKSAELGQKLGLDRDTIALLQQGRQAVEAAVRSGKEFARYTKEDAEAAAKANEAIGRMKAVFMQLVTKAIRPFIPLLGAIATGMQKFARFVEENSQAIGIALGIIAGVITATMVPALTSMAAAALMAAAPFAPLIAIATALGLAIDDLIVFVQGGQSAFEEWLKSMGYSEAEIEKVRQALGTLGKVFDTIIDLLKAIFSMDGEGIKKALENMKQAASEAMSSILKLFGVSDETIKSLEQTFSGLGGMISKVGDLISAVFSLDGEGLKAAIQGILDEATKVFENVLKMFGVSEQTIESLKQAFSGIGKVISSVFKLMSAIFSLDGNAILQALQRLWAAILGIKDAFANLFTTIKNKLIGLLPGWAKSLLGVGDEDEKPEPEQAVASGNDHVDMEKYMQTASNANASSGGKNGEVTNNVSNNTSIGNVIVNTQATDSNGIARDIVSNLRNENNAAQSDGAYGS